MKTLRILNKINTIALCIYIPYLIFDYENVFFGKSIDDGVTVISLILFITTFICGGATLITANNKKVKSSVSLSEILSIGKLKAAVLLIVTALGDIIIFHFAHSEIVIFYIASSIISFAFVIAEKIIIQKIEASPYFTISIPYYFYPLPFITFIGGSIAASENISEEKQDAVIISLFIISGIMMCFLAWSKSFVVDKAEKSIEIDMGILSLFKGNPQPIYFEEIKYVKKKYFHYAVVCQDRAVKINRILNGTGKLKKTLLSSGIPFE